MIRNVDPYSPVWMPRPKRVRESENTPAQDLVLFSGSKEDTPKFLSVLKDVATDVAVLSNKAILCAALGAPMIAALLVAAKGVKDNPEAYGPLKDLLDKWRGSSDRDGYHIEGGQLEDVLERDDYRVIGNRVLLTPCETRPIPALGDKLWEVAGQVRTAGRQELEPHQEQLSHLSRTFPHGGDTLLAVQKQVLCSLPELATPAYLRSELEDREGTLPTIGAFYGPSAMLDEYLTGQPTHLDGVQLLSHIRDDGFQPSEEQVERLVQKAGAAIRSSPGDNRAYEWDMAILDALGDAVSLEQRIRLQESLLKAGPICLSMATFNGPTGRLTADHPELAARLLDRKEEVVAQCLLLSAPLTDEQWQSVPTHGAVQFAHGLATLARDLRKLSDLEAVERVENLDLSAFGQNPLTAPERAREVVFQHFASRGDYPQLARLKEWETKALYPYLVQGVKQGRTDETLAEMDAVLERMAPGRLCYQQLVGKLAGLGAPLTLMAQRYEELNHSDEAIALQALRLFGRGDEEAFRTGKAWLMTLPEDPKLATNLARLEPAQVPLFGKLALTLGDSTQAAEGVAALGPVGEAGIPLLKQLHEVRAPQADELFPAAWAYEGDREAALQGLKRLSPLTNEESYLPTALRYFAALQQGSSVDQALDAALRSQLTGAEKAAPAGIGRVGDNLSVGGSLLRRRTRT